MTFETNLRTTNVRPKQKLQIQNTTTTRHSGKRSTHIKFLEGPAVDTVLDASAKFRGHTYLPIINLLITELQRVQNTAARITLRMPKTEHTTPLLRMLHWLPIPSRIAYKIDFMPYCIDYCISKISVRAVECVYASKTTARIIGSKYPQHSSSKGKVIWTASICLPGTHQLEQGPWQH